MTRYAAIKVTMDVEYLFEVNKDGIVVDSAKTIDQIKRDWFEDYDINRHHASRDVHQVGGSKKIVAIGEPTFIESDPAPPDQ